MNHEVTDLARSQRMVRRLVTFGEAIFPLRFPNDHFRLQRLSAALLARIIGSADAAAAVGDLDRRADLAAIMRSLYEHVVMLAWLNGSDSHRRMLLWQRYNDEARLRVDREVVTILREEPLLAADVRHQLESDVAEMGSNRLPSLLDRAATADREWNGRAYFGDRDERAISLRGIYTSLYRPMSGAAHPTEMGLSLVTSRGETDTIVDLESRGDAASTVGVAAGLLVAAFGVSASVIGRPDPRLLEPIVDAVIADLHGA